MNDARATYAPIDTLKAVTDDVWIVDGPVIRFGFPWPKMPFPTRMTIVRLLGGGLFVHSPTALTPALRAQVDALGPVRHLVGPNRIHYWWMPEWHAAYPQAEIYLAPRIKEQARERIDFEALPIERTDGYPWDAEIATLPVPGGFMTEVEFFHRASRTLILTDLIENFETKKLGSPFLRFLMWIGGVAAPHGGTPRDLRLTFTWRHKAELREAVETMLSWNPERIIIAHGRWFECGGAAELRRAFGWLLRG
jgi:hypothetical protein